jgi:hydroxymethylbilane synthase
VLDGRADLAVHSLKDLPTDTLPELVLAGIPPRAPRFDALVLPHGQRIEGLDQLPAGARIGTGSLRRRAQLLHVRPELVTCDIRGNVETRLKKLDAGGFEAIILAEAGLERLELGDRVNLVLQPPLMYPAVGQAAIGIECRAGDGELIKLLDHICDPIARAETAAERACLAELRAGCHAPVGVWATVGGATLRIEAVVLSPDGRQRLTSAVSGVVSDPQSVGREIAHDLFRQGAESLIRGEG